MERKWERGKGWGLVFVDFHFTAARGWSPMTIEAAVVSFALHPLYLHPFSRPLSPAGKTPVNLSRLFHIVVVVWIADEKQWRGSAQRKIASRGFFHFSSPPLSHSPSRNSLVLSFVLIYSTSCWSVTFCREKKKRKKRGEKELGHFLFFSPKRKSPIEFGFDRSFDLSTRPSIHSRSLKRVKKHRLFRRGNKNSNQLDRLLEDSSFIVSFSTLSPLTEDRD